MGNSEDLSEGLTVRLFASLREQAGWSERIWPIPGDQSSTPSDLWNSLGLGQGPMPSSIRIAVNQHFAAANQPLHRGDEVAFMPPISGG
jgi:molybdopterin synthase sulfur carrier subunit